MKKYAHKNSHYGDETIEATFLETQDKFPELVVQVASAYSSSKPCFYFDEISMIFRLVLGKTVKEFRLQNGLKKSKSIMPYITRVQAGELEYLQMIDTGLILGVPYKAQRRLILLGCLAEFRETDDDN